MFKSNTKKELEDVSASSTLIAKGAKMDGHLDTAGNLRIEGFLKGDINCTSKVVIGDTGEVQGDVVSQNAEVAGKVVGDIKIKELLVLKASAQVEGNIHTNKIIIENGAIFNGTCHMSSVTTQKLKKDESEKVLGKEAV